MVKMTTLAIICAALCRVICNGAEVTIAGDDYPLVFRDAGVSASVQGRIADELTLTLAHVADITNAFNFTIVDDQGCSYFERPFTPVVATEISRHLMYDTNGSCRVIVGKELSDKYMSQFAKAAPYMDIVAKVDGFIAQFNSGAVTNLSVADQRALMVETGRGIVDYPDDEVRDVMIEMAEKHFYPPSILEFTLVDVMGDGVRLPSLLVIFSRWRDSEYIDDALPIVYYNGGWRLLGITE